MIPRSLLFLLLAALAASGAEHRVTSAAEIDQLAATLQPGDVLLLRDGSWTDQAITLKARGSAGQPITLRAETPGKVALTGASSLAVEGEHLVVSGLLFQGGRTAKDGIALRGANCRLTETAIIDSTYKFDLHLTGTGHRVDRCYFAGKTSEGPTVQIEVGSTPNGNRLEQNHFGPRPPLRRNGGETIRIGYSHQSFSESGTIVERNLFEQCDGELEIISNKSCGNIYRGNTFLECAGMLTLRHGNRCLIEGNYFLGRGKRGSGGIRVIGEDHTVINNYIEGVEQGAFWITSGIVDSPLVGYFQARNCLIAFNTVVDSRGPCVDVSTGIGSANRTLLPEKITVANNVFSVAAGGALLKGRNADGFTWLGNFVAGADDAAGQIRAGKLAPLVRGEDGLWRLPADCAARGGAEGKFAAITTDIEGDPRPTPADAGADQAASGRPALRPLTRGEVGPGWRRAVAHASLAQP